jgi:hypothetical protein
MPQQQQHSSFAAKLGKRVSAANAQFKDQPPIETQVKLPAGVKGGIALLSAMYQKEQTEEGKKTPKGQTFFRASAVALSPEYVINEHGVKERVAGAITQVVIPMCDVAAYGKRKAVSFEENYNEYRSLFRRLDITEPNLGPDADPMAVEQYYFAAMQALTNPARPVYISFSTRLFKPEGGNPMVMEDWHGLADPVEVARVVGKSDPGAGMQDREKAPPASNGASGKTLFDAVPPAPTAPPLDTGNTLSLTEEVFALVEAAQADPAGQTPEGFEATARLEELATSIGWTEEQIKNPPAPFANDWAGIGQMILNPPGKVLLEGAADIKIPEKVIVAVKVGDRCLYVRRTLQGEKMKNRSGQEFPPEECEVKTVNEADGTCTLATRDGREVQNMRTKQPVQVKWDWLEPLPTD